jgi:hypothetical protein
MISLWAGSMVGQSTDYGLRKTTFSPDELMTWIVLGKGKVERSGPSVAMQESNDSKGIMLVSPEAYSSDVVVRYKVMALTSATVLVALLSVSDVGETGDLSIPEDYDGSLGIFTRD